MPEDTWSTVNEINDLIKNNPSWGLPYFETGIIIGDNSIMADKNGKIDAGIKINPVKPYIGIGFGRSVPTRSWGFQFDLGCMFHGKPKIVSKNAGVADALNTELDSSGFVDIINKITIYPVISFKLIKKYFKINTGSIEPVFI